jgi:hypothetical protein
MKGIVGRFFFQFGMTFTFAVFIMLMGLVTKNAILLVDFTNHLRAQGMSTVEAPKEAGPIRRRSHPSTLLTLVVCRWSTRPWRASPSSRPMRWIRRKITGSDHQDGVVPRSEAPTPVPVGAVPQVLIDREI